jgi:NAD(P)-dependent dehydrogenase (short-subunit alcohol dehydrogenase family)
LQDHVADGRVIILTGAAGLLGRAMAKALADAGHRLVLSDLAEENLREVAAATRGRVVTCAADLTHEGGPDNVVRTCLDAFGRVDMLINNAALTAFAAWPEDRLRPEPWRIDVALMRRFFEINTVAQHALTSIVLPGMVEQGWGRIVFVTCSYDTMHRIFPYGATKAALEAYAGSLNGRLGGTGVTANTLNPGGPVASPELVTKNPGRKWVGPEVMNGPVLWLASEASAAMVGRRYLGTRWNSALEPRAAAEQASGALTWSGFGEEALK